MFRRIIALLTLTCVTVLSRAQDNNVYLDLQVMGRGEVRDGGLPNADDASQDHSAFFLSRSRLVVGYKRPEFEVKTSMQHSGIWGQADKGSFNIHEAWIRLNAPFGLFTKLGRQALSYDDERIIGPNDFATASLPDSKVTGINSTLRGLSTRAQRTSTAAAPTIPEDRPPTKLCSWRGTTMTSRWLPWAFP